MNKISTPLGILIILVIAILVGGSILAYQYWWLPKQESSLPKNPSITVLSPSSGENWQQKQTYAIKWNSSGNISNVNIYVGKYGIQVPGPANNWSPTTVATNIPNSGYYNWTVPDYLLGQYAIRIDVPGGSYSEGGVSAPFSITAPSITVLSPNGGETWEIGKTYEIKWAKGQNPNDTVTIFLNNEKAWSNPLVIKSGIANTGSYSWTIPQSLNDSSGAKVTIENDYGYKILVQGTESGNSDFSDATFGIVRVGTPYINVLSPHGGEQWAIGSKQTIRWSYDNLSSTDLSHVTVSIELWGVDNSKDYFIKNYSDYNNLVVKANDANSYTLTIPTNPLKPNGGTDSTQVIEPGKYQIYIEGQFPSGEEKVTLLSGKSNIFSIVSGGTPSITVLSPNGGETWEIGKTYEIKWQPGKYPNRNVSITLINPKFFVSGLTIIPRAIQNTGVYSWTIPSSFGTTNIVPDDNYKIMVGSESLLDEDQSDATFSISVAEGCSMKWWFDNSTTVCSQKQFCGAYMYYGLQTFDTQADCQAALTAVD